jgi:cobalt-zinc-cadmium efflux system outer membrane protein
LKITITNQVIAAFNQYKKNYEGLTNYTDEYLNSLTQLNHNTNTYFQKRDISLLEFIDYQRIYISTNIQLIELRQQFLNSVNNLNFSVGEPVIEY